MGVRFACHHCGKRLNIKRELAGKRGICPACSTRFRIPLQDAERSQPLPEHPAGGDAAESQPAPAAQEAPRAAAVSDSGRPIALADAPSATWYVRPPSGGQYGPATSEVLREWVEEGRLAASALVWRDGWPQWREAREAFPGWRDHLLGAAGVTHDAAAPSGSDRAIEAADETAGGPHDDGEPALRGEANVAAVRRRRASRRVLVIGLLLAVTLALLAALAIILLVR